MALAPVPDLSLPVDSFESALKSGEEGRSLMNKYGTQKRPFLFIIDYHKNQCYVSPREIIPATEIHFDFNGLHNVTAKPVAQKLRLTYAPIPRSTYERQFNKVKSAINQGNSYLTNLTLETPISSSLDLQTLFHLSRARYRLWIKDHFLVFSPESFVKIMDGKIYSFPMKGTISANLRGAEAKILSDMKEIAEHATIVDLIRNDLSMVARNVQVNKFRYLEKIITNREPLIQVSSEIRGDLPRGFHQYLGDIIFSLLPAGSISGAPKTKTLEIINQTETHDRGFYTGVCGIFDGKNLDSGVMIRFIKKENNRLFFKSGGGITSLSKLQTEYEEYISKIYVPVAGKY